MAPKKRLPLVDDPPTASSSSSDEQPPSTQKPADKVIDEEEEEDSSEEGDEEGSSSSEEEEEENQTQQTPSKESKPVSKNPPPSAPISNPKPAESESGSGSGSESGSESGTESDSEPEQEHEPTPPPNPKVKPIASKPMKAQTQAQSTPVPAKSGTKRAAENNTANGGGNDSKRAKKKTTATAGGGGSEDGNEAEEDVKMTGEDSKRSSQRLFSEEDELKILKGLDDFYVKTGKDPMKETAAFHSFMKKSMKAEVNGEQLKRKVRSLKKKFETSENFTKPHDKQAFELFKKVWGKSGSKEAEENGNSNEKTAKSAKKEATIKNGGSAKKEATIKDGGSAKKEATIKDGGSAKKELTIVTTKESGKVEGGFDKSVILSELVQFDDAVGMAALNKDAAKRGLELMGESNRVALEERWKKLQIAEMEVFVNRAELIRDQSRLVLQELKKKSSH